MGLPMTNRPQTSFVEAGAAHDWDAIGDMSRPQSSVVALNPSQSVAAGREYVRMDGAPTTAAAAAPRGTQKRTVRLS